MVYSHEYKGQDIFEKATKKNPSLIHRIQEDKANCNWTREVLKQWQSDLKDDKWMFCQQFMEDSELEDHEETQKLRKAMKKM